MLNNNNPDHPTEVVDTIHHWNTNHLSGEEFTTADTKAEKQEIIVLRWFRQYPEMEFTPCEVWQGLIAKKQIAATVPITSIRRAICNLTRNLFLIRTMNKKTGLYGAANFTWKLAQTGEQIKLF